MKISNTEKINLEGLDTNRLLSEAEACSTAGITIDTLRSYTQFSLLKPVIRNQKPFYRLAELTQLFNIEDTVPTLDNLLSEEDFSEQNGTTQAELEPLEVEQKTVPEESKSNLPAVRVEDVILQNQALNTRIKSLEDERDWLRKRVEILEERSAREQMLMLKEKETLSEIINATLVTKERFSLGDYIKRLKLPFFNQN